MIPAMDHFFILIIINNRSEWTRLGEIWQSQIPSALENETADGILKKMRQYLALILAKTWLMSRYKRGEGVNHE